MAGSIVSLTLFTLFTIFTIFTLTILFVVMYTCPDGVPIHAKSLPSPVVSQTPEKVLHNTEICKRITDLFSQLDIKHVVVWGFPLHYHTHSYIHEAFVRAAESVGSVSVLWVPQLAYDRPHEPLPPYTGPVDNVLFITEGQVVDGIPQSDQSWYIFHNVLQRDGVDFSKIPTRRILNLQYWSHDCTPVSKPLFDEFHRLSDDMNTIYMPWATNLLPHEFEELVKLESNADEVVIIGQNGPEYFESNAKFMSSTSLTFQHKNANVTQEDMIKYTRKAKCAPALVTGWQKDHGYIPCRIMKNISYGQVPVTNSVTSSAMLHFNTICDEDEAALAVKFDLVLKPENLEKTRAIQYNAHKLVNQRHTYLNRLECILFALSVRNSKQTRKQLNVLHFAGHEGWSRYVQHVAKELNWNLKTNSTDILDTDAIIISDSSYQLGENFLDNYKGKVIICGVSPARVLEEATTNYSDRVRVVSSTKLERVHAINQGIFWTGPFADAIICPFLNAIRPFANEPNIELSNIPSDIQISKSDYLFVPPYENDNNFVDYDFLHSNNILFYHGTYKTYNGPDDLVGFKAILHIPNQNTIVALFENLLRGIVHYIPSKSFLLKLVQCPPELLFGIYNPSTADMFVMFDSWEDFKTKLDQNEHESKTLIVQNWSKRESENSLFMWKNLVEN